MAGNLRGNLPHPAAAHLSAYMCATVFFVQSQLLSVLLSSACGRLPSLTLMHIALATSPDPVLSGLGARYLYVGVGKKRIIHLTI